MDCESPKPQPSPAAGPGLVSLPYSWLGVGQLNALRNGRLLPLPRFSRMEHRLDHGHVLDSALERDRQLGTLAKTLREKISLNGILVHNLEFYDLGAPAGRIGAVVYKNSARFVGRSIERNLDFNSPFSAQDLNFLIRRELSTAGENTMSGRIVQNSGAYYVGSQIRICFDN